MTSTGQQIRRNHAYTVPQKCSAIPAWFTHLLIKNQTYLPRSHFWLHATSILEYHLEAVMTTLGISPGLPVDLPQVGSTAPLCMTFSSWYGAGFNVSDFLTWNLDTSWETMWAGFLPSLCEPYFASVIRMFKVPEVYLLSQLIDGIKPTLYFWPPYFVQLVFSPKLMAYF